jgi:hypothetical protein
MRRPVSPKAKPLENITFVPKSSSRLSYLCYD